MKLYESFTKNLNESSSDSKYVDAYLDLALSMNDGMGDVSGNIEWAEMLANDYNIKYDEDSLYDDTQSILKKALTTQIKKDPGEFKNGIESFVEYSLLEYGDDEYLYSKVHKEPNLLNDVTVLLDYLSKNNGDKKAIEGLQNIIGNVDNIAINSRQIGEELCRYMNDHDIYKYLGTNVRFWTKNELDLFPSGYTCMVGGNFNLLLFKKTNVLHGLAVLFKDSKTEVVAEIFTFGWNDEAEAHNVIIDDNFKSTGDTFVITPENKEQMFKKIFNTFKNTVNKLKVENVQSEKEYKKYWGKSGNEYQEHLKKYSYRLKNVGVKEAVEVSYDDNYDFKSDESEDAVYCANCAQPVNIDYCFVVDENDPNSEVYCWPCHDKLVKVGALQESNLKESWYSDSFESIEGVEKEVGDNYTVYKYYDGNNRPIAAMFYGKTQKPNFHTRFANDQERDEYIQEYLNQRESRNKANAERRQARKLTKDHDIQVGDIYYTSWGYDQTNIDYYQVVNVRGSRIDLKELKQEVVETYPGSEYVMPVKDDFASDRIYTVSARADGTVTNLSSFEYLSKWDGRPHYQTDGYSGH